MNGGHGDHRDHINQIQSSRKAQRWKNTNFGRGAFDRSNGLFRLIKEASAGNKSFKEAFDRSNGASAGKSPSFHTIK